MSPSSFKEKLGLAFGRELPGEAAQVRMTPLTRPNFERARLEAHKYRESGVSVIIFTNANGEYEIVLIQRPEYEGKHGGQVSFPGGKKEADDESLMHTAIRECKEEIGVELSSLHYLGALTPVYIPVSLFLVEPHVFYLDHTPDFYPDSYEVSEVFSIGLKELVDDANVKQLHIKVAEKVFLKDVPYFDLQNKVIWGATAVILSELKELIRSLD